MNEVKKITDKDHIYYDWSRIISRNKPFNFVVGDRSIGKTFSVLKNVIYNCITTRTEFVIIFRTKRLIEEGFLHSSLNKVVTEGFCGLNLEGTNNIATYEGRTLCEAIALTDYSAVKRKSFPHVKWIIFDEYVVDEFATTGYVKGYNEPELFINIYHTIDRDSGKVRCIFLGNKVDVLNPYHTYKPFQTIEPEYGRIVTNKITAFEWAKPNDILLEKFSDSSFRNMIEGTGYANKHIASDKQRKEVIDIPLKTTPYLSFSSDNFIIGFRFFENVFYVKEENKKYAINTKVNDVELKLFRLSAYRRILNRYTINKRLVFENERVKRLFEENIFRYIV